MSIQLRNKLEQILNPELLLQKITAIPTVEKQTATRRERKPWALKCTTHMSELETLFELFPKVTVVHCHRDPCQAIPSYSKLQEHAWNLRGNPSNPHAIGRTMMDIWTKQIQTNLNSRAKPNINSANTAMITIIMDSLIHKSKLNFPSILSSSLTSSIN